MEKIEKIVKEMAKSELKNRDNLAYFKRKIAKKYKMQCPKNILLLKAYHKLVKEKSIQPQCALEAVLRTRPVRSLSGIVNVSVLTKPWPCKGKCLFCPTQKNIPKSYLSQEPAVQRAVLNKFSPYKQVQCRLEALKMTGHPTDKIEIRVIGGTWDYYPKKYREWFTKELYRGCNEFATHQISNFMVAKSKNNFSDNRAQSALFSISNFQLLKAEQKQNETAKARVVGLSVETRPDCINAQTIKKMRELGITKVELGVQTIFNDVLVFNQRGHKVEATINATRLLKEAGFKVSFQIMPDLPGSNFRQDILMARELFSNPDFKPDSLKIYPMALVKSSGVYRLYKQGKYKPLTKEKLVKLLIAIKQQTPCWCRIERIVRDIPSVLIIEGGAKTSNLRELVKKEMSKQGMSCKCIRCREVGDNFNPKEKPMLWKEEYGASKAREVFLSFENKARTKLFALLRLRLGKTAIIRELHTFGQAVELTKRVRFLRGQTSQDIVAQHRGLGKKLVAAAENIAKQQDYKKIAVISAVGVRGYYRKLGYRLQNTYMVKRFV